MFARPKNICIYHHNCADGFGAAWVVRKALGNDVEFYPGVYQSPPPDVAGKHVILVDFSYKRDVIEEMLKTAASILIIDHHKTAIEDLADFRRAEPGRNIRCIFDVNRSGAMLAWLHYFPNEIASPRLIEHIEDRDLWRWKLDGSKEILAAVFSWPYDFQAWDVMMATDTQNLYNEGTALLRAHMKDIHEFIAAAAGRMIIDGYNVPCLNAPYCWSSDAGNIMSVDEAFAACYWETPECQQFSLRSNDYGMDVSVIAKKFGGGGHKHAAGFKMPPGQFLTQVPKRQEKAA